MIFHIIMVVIYCYLRKDNDKVLKFHMNDSSYFKIIFWSKHVPILSLKLNVSGMLIRENTVKWYTIQ